MRRSITLKESSEILHTTPKIKIERECNSWGCCLVHYDEYLMEGSIYSTAEKYLKNKSRRLKKLKFTRGGDYRENN